MKPPMEPAFVYIIASGDLVKIGVSKSPADRLRGLSTGSPERPRLVSSREFKSRKDAFAMETRLHRLFARNRANGEWFRIAANHAARSLHKVHVDSDGDGEKVVAEAFRRMRHEPTLL